MPRKLIRQEAHEFLDSKPGWIMLSTVGPDGYPHTVPLGYFRLGDEILMGVRSGTRKLRNIQGNPKVSLLLENGRTRKDIKGLMIQGTATLHTNPEETLHYAREAAKRRGVPESELPMNPRENAAYIRWCRIASVRGIIQPTPRNSDGNPDSPQVVVFLTSIIDVIEGLGNVIHTLACRVRLQYVWLA